LKTEIGSIKLFPAVNSKGEFGWEWVLSYEETKYRDFDHSKEYAIRAAKDKYRRLERRRGWLNQPSETIPLAEH